MARTSHPLASPATTAASVTPRSSAERGREVRQKLLRAAVELIPELGWNCVSTRILAQRADLAAGLVHYHFQSVEALLQEATLGMMRKSLEGAMSALEQAATLESGLDALLSALDAITGTDAASLLFIEAYLASLRNERLRSELAALLGEFRTSFARWLAAYNQEAPEVTAAVLAAAIDGVLLHRALNTELTARNVVPVLRRLLSPPRATAKTRGKSEGNLK